MRLPQMLKMCLNPKVLITIGIIIVLAYIFVPQLVRYAWILLALACPISMMIMMYSMNDQNKHGK